MSDYDYLKSTEDNYRQEVIDGNRPSFVGKFAAMRSKLDYTYHMPYNVGRQRFQDSIIDLFNETIIYDGERICDRPTENWIVFTSGPMGAGKSHTLTWLSENGLFPLEGFVRVDPDSLRELLPETTEYMRRNPATAGHLTQKEAGYIAEILTLDALLQGKNTLVDGSLRDSTWYKHYIAQLRSQFTNLKVGILNVRAKKEIVLARAHRRALITGRMVPEDIILETIELLPTSLFNLAPYVDVIVTFENNEDVPRLVETFPPEYLCNNGVNDNTHSSTTIPVPASSCALPSYGIAPPLQQVRTSSPFPHHKVIRTLPEFQALWEMKCPFPSQKQNDNRYRSRTVHIYEQSLEEGLGLGGASLSMNVTSSLCTVPRVTLRSSSIGGEGRDGPRRRSLSPGGSRRRSFTDHTPLEADHTDMFESSPGRGKDVKTYTSAEAELFDPMSPSTRSVNTLRGKNHTHTHTPPAEDVGRKDVETMVGQKDAPPVSSFCSCTHTPEDMDAFDGVDGSAEVCPTPTTESTSALSCPTTHCSSTRVVEMEGSKDPSSDPTHAAVQSRLSHLKESELN